MQKAVLQVREDHYQAIIAHLLPDDSENEEAAFGFAQSIQRGSDIALTLIDWHAVDSRGFEHQSGYHLELADEMRPFLIKRAHDLECSLVEFHSHPGPWPAQFSESDFIGLSEFVPHVWWRLKKRPYAAVVVAPSGFDGLVWLKAADAAEPLMGIEVNGSVLQPTGLSWRALQRRRAWTV